MPALDPSKASARALTFASYVSFVPIGIATVLLGPMLPTLSARWSLNYSQAGALFTAQYVASTCAVALSGLVVSRKGFRFAINCGLLLMASGLALLLAASKTWGILCIAAYGGGLGLAVPAANLLVAEVNPTRRSATLSWLNFCWSAGAVACPFLVAEATKLQRIPSLLRLMSAFSLLVALGIALMPSSIVEPAAMQQARVKILPLIRRRRTPFLILAALFFLYVGTENGFGGWVATYSKTLGNFTPAMSLITPSFFYISLMLGRSLAPVLLRWIDEITLVRGGLILACAGTGGLVISHTLAAVLVSACAAGFGLAHVYPITISLLSKEFGAMSSRIGSTMFVLSNIGGGLFPWIVGIFSNRFGTLKAGLLVPLVGCAAMYFFYLHQWGSTELDPAN